MLSAKELANIEALSDLDESDTEERMMVQIWGLQDAIKELLAHIAEQQATIEKQAGGIAARDGQLKMQAECIERLRRVVKEAGEMYWPNGTSNVRAVQDAFTALQPGDMGDGR